MRFLRGLIVGGIIGLIGLAAVAQSLPITVSTAALWGTCLAVQAASVAAAQALGFSYALDGGPIAPWTGGAVSGSTSPYTVRLPFSTLPAHGRAAGTHTVVLRPASGSTVILDDGSTMGALPQPYTVEADPGQTTIPTTIPTTTTVLTTIPATTSLPATTTAPGMPPANAVKIADEGGSITVSGTVWYGARTSFTSKPDAAGRLCNNSTFGFDPLPLVPKACYAVLGTPTTTIPATTTVPTTTTSVPVNPCVAQPGVLTVTTWPTSAEGRQRPDFTYTVAGVVTTWRIAQFSAAPMTLTVTDARGCVVVRVK